MLLNKRVLKLAQNGGLPTQWGYGVPGVGVGGGGTAYQLLTRQQSSKCQLWDNMGQGGGQQGYRHILRYRQKQRQEGYRETESQR